MICLVGESASGKSTIEKELVKFGWKNIISYTTRKPRKGEKDGINYHFVSEEIFNKMKANGEFAETAIYNGWQYGTAKNDCKDDRVIVVNPHGLRQFKKIPDLNVISFYINVPRRDRLIKILQRGDDIEEAYRRSVHDDGQFAGIEEEVDYVIDNPNYKIPAKVLATNISLKVDSRIRRGMAFPDNDYRCVELKGTVTKLFDGYFRWQDIKTKKPSKNGWYLTTVEFPLTDTRKQKYVMMLYYRNGIWRNNIRRDVFHTYTVLDIFGKHLHFDRECDRTTDVIAWCKLPDAYTKE